MVKSDLNIKAEIEKRKLRVAKVFIWAAFFVYVLTMGSKNVFTAELVTLMDVFGTTKAETSLAMTYYFATYAIGQVILSFVMEKINLRIYLSVTGALSAVLTVLFGFMPNMQSLYVLCAANGILQAGVFSGCMAAFGRYLPPSLLTYSNRLMTAGTGCWGVLSYGIPPIFVGRGLWNVPFFLLGGLFFISVVFFFVMFKKLRECGFDSCESLYNANSDLQKPFFELKNRKKTALYLCVAFVVVLLNESMQYMVMNWIPNMLYDVFSIPQSYSILITLIIPVISAVGSIIAINICENAVRNVFMLSAVFTLIALVSILPMIFIFDLNAALSVVLIALFIAFAAGARVVFAGIVAFKMQSQIDAGSFLAATNAVGAVAAAVIPPIAGSVIDSFSGVSGYGITYLLTFIIGIGSILAILFFSRWYKKQG